MITQFLTRLFTSRPIKMLILLAVLVLIASQAVPQMVDANPYVERISAEVKTMTGAAMLVKGGAMLQILPHPALLLRNVEITQPDVARSPTLGADIAEFGIHLPSLFSGVVTVDKLTITKASLIAERQENGQPDWGYLGAPFLKSLSSTKPTHPLQISILSGQASIADVKTGKTTGITDMQLSGILASESSLSGMFQYNKQPITFSATRSGAIGATPIALQLTVDNGPSLSLNGSMDFTAEYPLITGKLAVASTDISHYIAAAAAADKTPVPLKLSGDYLQQQGSIQLSNLTLDTLGSQATGQLGWSSADNSYTVGLNFSALDLTNVRQLLTAYVSGITSAENDGMPKTLTAPTLNVSLDITADKILHNTQQWSRSSFNGSISDGVLTVNQLTLSMPGDSMVTLFGLLSISDTQGLRFEGNTEAKGGSLRDLLTIFDESAVNLPALGFGAYQLKSNLFVSKELLRLSEANAQFSELTLKGGLVTYFDKKPRIESDVILNDINFDYYRDSWRNNTNKEEKNTFLRFDRTMNFDWLKKLQASIDFRVQVQGFTFLERKGTGASFRLFAQAGEFGIYNAKFVYPTDTTEGNLKLDVAGDTPSINLVLNTSVLNSNYFAHTPLPPEPVLPPDVAPAAAAVKPSELPDMAMPTATPEDELRQKIQEEAQEIEAVTPAIPESNVPVIDAEKPVTTAGYEDALPEETASEEADPVELMPLLPQAIDPSQIDDESVLTITPQSLTVSEPEAASRWSQELIDFGILEGISGTFDITVGKLQHKERLFENFKMMAKLERNLLTFQTLTFLHWGGSFSINGTLFGGKVPGISLGFIIASADIDQMLATLLGMQGIGGRASISGTLDTSGVNMLSWVSQANAKLLLAGRGVTIQGFDMASVTGAVMASRTAADVFNNVNLSIVGGIGEYSADGSFNLAKGVLSTPGIALKTGRVIGNVTGDFRLLPWDLNLSGSFKFPDLSTENVPTLGARWSGPIGNLNFQTDTQSLEAFASKRITGN